MSHNVAELSARGAWDVKRYFTLPGLSQPEDAEAAERQIGDLPGVRGVEADAGRHRVTVVYDLTELDYCHVTT
jgi:hypothetical protein